MFTLEPVAFVEGGRREAVDDRWGGEVSRIVLAEGIGEEALLGLEGFSHVEVVFVFHGVKEGEVERGARHPRGNKAWPLVGIFAQRAKMRPNRLGVSVAKIVKVAGRVVTVEGLDAIEGTPVVDIKPVMRGFLPRGEVKEPAWVGELMGGYWT